MPASIEREPEVLVAHDFAETWGGAERIATALLEAFPRARFTAILGRREVLARMGVADRSSLLMGEDPRLLRHYRSLAPLYPLMAAHRHLPAADLLISSSYAFAHGFRTRNGAPHLCYCYSPLRFAWTMAGEYGVQRGGPPGRVATTALAAPFRSLDRRAAARVDRYVAESRYVADQIERFYGREAEVVHPPVNTERFKPSGSPPGDYALFCGRLIEPYKRPTMVVEAFRQLPDIRLVVAGAGPEEARLRATAPPNVEFRGHLGTAELAELMGGCAFAIFPSRDDFGLVPVEVMACGRPVLAYAGGGALETVPAGVAGELFEEQSVDALVEAIGAFDPGAYDPGRIRAHAERFAQPRFERAMREHALALLD